MQSCDPELSGRQLLSKGVVVRAGSMLRTEWEVPAKGPYQQNGVHTYTASGPFRNKGQSLL